MRIGECIESVSEYGEHGQRTYVGTNTAKVDKSEKLQKREFVDQCVSSVGNWYLRRDSEIRDDRQTEGTLCRDWLQSIAHQHRCVYEIDCEGRSCAALIRSGLSFLFTI